MPRRFTVYTDHPEQVINNAIESEKSTLLRLSDMINTLVEAELLDAPRVNDADAIYGAIVDNVQAETDKERALEKIGYISGLKYAITMMEGRRFTNTAIVNGSF